MRRAYFVVAAVLAMFAVAAYAADVNVGKPVVRVAASGYAVIDSSLNVGDLATSYSIYSVDASDDFYVRRKMGSVWESAAGMKVTAGNTLYMPAPQAEYASSGYWRHIVFIGDAADTTVVLPWSR